MADMDTSCPVRFATTVPTQSLNMLNGKFMNDSAKLFAKRLRDEAGDDPSAQVAHGFKIAFSRKPTDKEIAAGLAMIKDQTSAASKQYLVESKGKHYLVETKGKTQVGKGAEKKFLLLTSIGLNGTVDTFKWVQYSPSSVFYWNFGTFFMNTSPICANFIFLKTVDPFQMSQNQ